MRMHIAIDLDDVVVAFFQGVLDSMYTEFGVSIDIRDCTTWDDTPVHHFNWESFGYGSWWDWLRQREWLWAQFGAMPGAIGGVSKLRAQGHYLEAVTSKPRWAEHNVWKWIGKYRPAFNRVTIVPIGEAKVDYTNADILVDDSVENITDFLDDGRIGILYDRPWNAGPYTEDFLYADNWRDVTDLIAIMAHPGRERQ